MNIKVTLFALCTTLLQLSTISRCNNMTYFAPSLFVNHGGGPNPVLGEVQNKEIANALRNIKNYVDIKQLKAVILITAHREEDIVTISSGKHHHLYFDYYNFPPEAYKLKYPAPGHPELAREIHEELTKAGIQSQLEDQRGWDHGVFIPMILINPSADIPIVQVSILKNQNAEEHYALGKALYRFRERGVAIIGSGLSYHNMKELMKSFKSDGITVNTEFHKFLEDVCLNENRKKDILNWQSMPGALDSHPLGNADHLMPLIVNIGASGGSQGRNIFTTNFKDKFILSNFIWG